MTLVKKLKCLLKFSIYLTTILSFPVIAQSANPWVGVWNSSYGPMTLSENNGIISGNYHRPNGETGFIYNGIASGNVLTGRWKEPTTYVPPYDEGDFVFTLSEDKLSFTGKWRYDQGSFWFGWIGTKGYSINGKVEMYDGSPFSGCEVELIQNNLTVKKMYTNSSGTFSFLNIQPGTYQVEPFSVDYIFNPKNRTVTLENKSIAGMDFKVANTFYITITYSGKSIAYNQEIDLTIEIKDAAGNYINEQHSIQVSEINGHVGTFTPSSGLVTTSGGKATIKYRAPSQAQAGTLKNLLIKAEDKNITTGTNYTILKIPFDLEVWAEPKDPSVGGNSRTAIIPADEQFPALISAKCVDGTGNAQANVPIKFSLDINSPCTLYSGDQNSKSITVNTNDDGIARAYYKYLGPYTGVKIIEEVTVENMNDERVGIVKIEVGLGLVIYKKERYQAQPGVIATDIGQNIVFYIRSNFHPNLDLQSYSVWAEMKVWKGKEIGVNVSIERINKPVPGTWDKFFTIPEDIVYKGKCSMDNLGNKNILYAIGNPSYDIGNNHMLPQIIPKSQGAHIYKIAANFIDYRSGNSGNETVMVNYPLLGFEVDREQSWFEDLACALAPSTSLQLYGVEGVKIFLTLKFCEKFAWIGDIITISDIVCKVMQGDKLGAVKTLANYLGGKYVDAKDAEFKKLWWLKVTNKSEYDLLQAALIVKNGVDWIQRLDSDWKIKAEEDNQVKLNKTTMYLDNVNDPAYQDLANQFFTSFLAGAQINNMRVVTVFNASQSKVTDNTGKEAFLIDNEKTNMGTMVYSSKGNAYTYLLDANSTFNLEFKTDKYFAVSICDPLKSTYTLYNIPSAQLLKAKLVINNSTNPLQLDYGDNGSIDENKNPEVITPGNTNPPQSKINFKQLWSKDFGGSINNAGFNPTGEKVLTGGADKAVKVWNAANGNLDWSGNHDQSVYSCSFSPDGSKIISAGADGKLKLWNASTGNLIWTADNTYAINYVAFNNDGSSVITSSTNLKLYNTSNGNLVWTNGQLYGYPKFSPDGKKIGTGAVNKINILDPTNGNVIWTGDHTDAREICFCSDGSRVLSTSYNGSIKVWNTLNGTLQLNLAHPGMIISGLFSPDGNKIASFTQSVSTLNMWDSNSGALLWRINEKTFIGSIDFSPGGNEVIYTSMDSIKIVSTATGNLLWKGGHYSVRSAKYSKDGKKIVSYGPTFPYKLIIWDQSLTDLEKNHSSSTPFDFTLYQNYPNPFNSETVISWQLAVGSQVTLKVYDVLGREITTLVNEFKQAGNHSTLFTLHSSFASGIYFYQLKAGQFMQTKKMILLR